MLRIAFVVGLQPVNVPVAQRQQRVDAYIPGRPQVRDLDLLLLNGVHRRLTRGDLDVELHLGL
ncbi:MAG: hypothetical protein COZ57_03750, partial [Armatimonadetes bacterium CG_4_8_14_3_um_filter_66_20]